MSVTIPENVQDLVDNPNIIAFSTVTPKGAPNTLPVWFAFDDGYLYVVSVSTSKKKRNIEANPNVTSLIVDPQNPYRFLEIRGVVEDTTEDGAIERVNKIAKHYTGEDQYYGGVMPAEQAEKETLVMFKIKPTRVISQG